MILKPQLNRILKYNLSLVSFGFLMAFFSSFGQTFLISLYVPSIEQFFNISNTEFGSIYAIATIGSALSLPWLGAYFDKVNTKKYSILVIAALFISLLTLSFSYHILMVVFAFYGLRLFGQGLMSHISVSSMARYFSDGRGKAIGIAGLGHAVGEALLPILITLLIVAAGWRGALQLSALSCLILMAPLSIFLLNKSKLRIRAYYMHKQKSKNQHIKLKFTDIVSQKKFWIISPLVFIVGFTNTAIFFFQLKLGYAKGWSPEWVAASVSAYALTSAIGMTGVGGLVDKFTAKKLFPFHMAFYLIGLLPLILFDHKIVYPIALGLIGLGQGIGKTVVDAMLAEVYGSDIIGQIRSVFVTVMVLSTALGPIAFGLLLDLNISYSIIFSGVLFMTLITMLNGLRKF